MNTPAIQTETTPAPTIQAEVDNQPSFLELAHTLWFRRRLLFSTAFIIIAVGTIYMSQLVPLYTASSTVLIGVPKSKVVDIEEVLGGGLGSNAAINNEIEMLSSRVLARKVIDKLNLLSKEEFNPGLRLPGLLSFFKPSRWIEQLKGILGSEPDTATALSEEEIDLRKDLREIATATNIFLGKLEISPVSRSDVIKIDFESTDPELAAVIANELPEIYIIDRMDAKLEATKKATKWLNEQLSDLKMKVENSEKSVELYRISHELTEVKGERLLSSQLSEINNQLILARAGRVQSELRLQQIKKMLSKGGSDIESAKEVMSSSVIQGLREHETSLTRKASELSVQFGPKHNRIKQVNAQINDVREKIDLEINRIVVALENEVEVARIREQSLGESLKEFEHQSGVQTKEAITLNALEREASANRMLFETFLNRFKETSSTTGMLEADARVISKAEIPGGASFPNRRFLLISIIVSAFFTASVLVFLVEAFSQGILNPEQIESKLGLAAIGLIPFVSEKKAYDYILEKPNSIFAEALNTLKTSLVLCSPDESVKVLQFTSSVPREGKSTLSITFARLLAKSGNKVILLDGDLRLGTLQKKLGISAVLSQGLTDLVMTSGGSIEEFVIKDKKSGAYIMPNGGAEYVNPTDVFSSHRMQAIVDLLKENFDYVIIDTPPVMAVSDARIIAKLVDKTVFVVEWDKTPRKVIQTAVQLLNDGGADIAGCVLNKVDLHRYASLSHGSSGYYYQHSHYGNYFTD